MMFIQNLCSIKANFQNTQTHYDKNQHAFFHGIKYNAVESIEISFATKATS